MANLPYTFRPELDALLTNDESVRRLKSPLANKEFVRTAQALIASPDFAARLDRLTAILSDAGAKAVDRLALQKMILSAGMLYSGMAWSGEQEPTTMHEMSEPIALVLDVLKRDANRAAILKALGGPSYVPAKGAEAAHDAAVKEAAARFANMLDALADIARALPDPPKKDRGRPPTRDLDALVDLLAQHWERMTGKAFTQAWHTESKGQRVPNSPGARFVYEIIEFIDSDRLPELPGVTARVVKERRKATS